MLDRNSVSTLVLSFPLTRVIVLVLNHTSMIHIVVLFLIVEINLRVTKLLLFPTATAAAV